MEFLLISDQSPKLVVAYPRRQCYSIPDCLRLPVQNKRKLLTYIYAKEKKRILEDSFVANTVFRTCPKFKLRATQTPHLIVYYLSAFVYISVTLKTIWILSVPPQSKGVLFRWGTKLFKYIKFQTQVKYIYEKRTFIIGDALKTNPAPIMLHVEAKQSTTKYYQNHIYRFITEEMCLRKR